MCYVIMSGLLRKRLCVKPGKSWPNGKKCLGGKGLGADETGIESASEGDVRGALDDGATVCEEG